MKPLPIDEHRVGKPAYECDLIEIERPRQPGWKVRRLAAYTALAAACDLAASNARACLPATSGDGA